MNNIALFDELQQQWPSQYHVNASAKMRAMEYQKIVRECASKVEHQVEQLSKHCRFLSDPAPVEDLPVVRRSEVRTAMLLGHGAFSEIYQVWGFSLGMNLDPVQQDAREFLEESVVDQQGRTRYVVKHLRRDLGIQNNKFLHAASDLVMEAKFLAHMDHPNIIKIRGWSGSIDSLMDGGHDGFFLLLDRIDENLSQRVVRWHREEQASGERLALHKRSCYHAKLNAALQLVDALVYLHDQDIIYRDLKPENVGFKDDRVVLFDFGLCRELPRRSPHENEVFRMSGVGTRRFMSPEVLLREQYNLKADVYSLSMVIYTIMAAKKPYENYNAEMHSNFVCNQGQRPTLPDSWPSDLKSLLTQSWTRSIRQRLSMRAVRDKLEYMLKAHDQHSQTREVSIVESSLEVMGSLFNVLQSCNGGNSLVRILEGDAIRSAPTLQRVRSIDYPHLHHLRSSYL